MNLKNLFLFTIVALLLVGCATKRFGRMMPLTGAETSAFSCKDIKVELAKVDAFELQVAKGDEMDALAIGALLADGGIGNRMEKNAALQSAKERKVQLNDIAAEKGCS